jgi:nicotinate-nucleotide pyrophosphorylase (carboxylating)
MKATRTERIAQALFQGGSLTLENLEYSRAARTFLNVLVKSDTSPEDLTAKALGMKERPALASIVARETGVAAGLAEFAFLVRSHGIAVRFEKQDGEGITAGDTLLHAEGDESKLLALERVGLNLLQRMSGIATAARSLQERVSRISSRTRVVGTRKTPWGMLDKRALHLGNGGTHRLGLGDAIVIKNNHLALLASREEDAVPIAIERAWTRREDAAFIEVEVRGEAAARAAARIFKSLRDRAAKEHPCLLMLDNMTPEKMCAIVKILQQENLWDHTLIEASGGITGENAEAYAAAGVDAISVGALTHSVKALDICQRIS